MVCQYNCEAIAIKKAGAHRLSLGDRLLTHSWQFMIILTHQAWVEGEIQIINSSAEILFYEFIYTL